MASTTQDELYRTFLAVSGQQTSAIGDATFDACRRGRADWRTTEQYAGAGRRPRPNSQTTTSQDSGSTLGAVASTVLKSGFGLAPMISGLVSLFGGGDAAAPPPLVKYAMPAAVDFQAAESGGRITNLDYDQMGLPRGSSGGGERRGECHCEWRAADHGERASDGRTLISRPEQRHCTGGAGRDAQYERDQRRSERALIWPLSQVENQRDRSISGNTPGAVSESDGAFRGWKPTAVSRFGRRTTGVGDPTEPIGRG